MIAEELIKARDELAEVFSACRNGKYSFANCTVYLRSTEGYKEGWDARERLLQEELKGLLEALERISAYRRKVPVGNLYMPGKYIKTEEAKMAEAALAAHRKLECEKGGER